MNENEGFAKVAMSLDAWMARAQAAEQFLERLAAAGRPRKMIVNTGAMTAEGIAEARAEGRMLVLENGLGFVICPLEIDTGPKRAPVPEALTNEPSERVVKTDFLLDLEHLLMHVEEISEASQGPIYAGIKPMLQRIKEVFEMGVRPPATPSPLRLKEE